MKTDLKKLSAAIGRIYDAAIDPDIWPQALAEICEVMTAVAGTINYHDITNGTALLAHEHGTDPHYSELYVQQFAHENPFIGGVGVHAIGDPRRMRDLVPTEVFEESELYRNWFAPQGYEDMVKACIYRDATRVGALAVARLAEYGTFDEDDLDLFSVISSHVHRSLSISNHLRLRKAEAERFALLVEQLSTPIFLIDGSGRLIYKNPAGTRLLDEKQAGYVAKNRLSLNDVDLDALIEGVKDRHFFETTVSAGGSEENLKVAAVAVRINEAAEASPIAIFLTGLPGEARPSEVFLRNAYKLTSAEIRLVFGLFEGLPPADYASRAGLSIATVRSQIASVREKTGARNQTELIRMLAVADWPVIKSI
jgi:DNA-binding CsgD family transcriptional regulator/PAS domain-containing protein